MHVCGGCQKQIPLLIWAITQRTLVVEAGLGLAFEKADGVDFEGPYASVECK